MIQIHEADEHAPFSHRYVKSVRHVITKTPNKKVVLDEYDVESAFVICAYCDHWIKRVVTACNCLASCHAEAKDE